MILNNMSKTAKLFIDAGFESDLYTKQQMYLSDIKEIVSFINQYNRKPNSRAKSLYELRLGKRLVVLRQLHKKGRLDLNIYQYLKKNDSDELLNINNPNTIENAKNKYYRLISFIHKNKRLPIKRKSDKEDDKEEIELAYWLNRMRLAKKGKSKNKFYPLIEFLAKRSKYPNIFNDNWRDDFS